MTMKTLAATLVCALPCLASAQQNTTAPPPGGVQASGQGQAQGDASVQRDGKTLQSQASGSGSAAGTVSREDKSVSADSGAATNAMLVGSLDSRKSKPGDPVTAKTTEPTTTSDHQSLPKGTKLLGHVTEAKAAGSGQGESALGMTFDRAVLKDGQEIPIHTTLRAVAAASGAADAAGGSAMGGGAMNGGSMASAPSGGGGLGGIGGRATGALGGVGQVAGSATGSVGGMAGATGGTNTLVGSPGALGGLNARGLLGSESRGVFGLQGVNLAQSTSGGGSLITSTGRSVHLDGGTRMLLGVERAASNGAAEGGASSTGGAKASGDKGGSSATRTP